VESENLDNPPASLCPHCKGSLAGLPKIARFCPRCGKTIAAFPATTVCQTIRDGLSDLAESMKEDLASTPAKEIAEEETTTSLTLLGFSNAMFRLGWRYEHGHGVFRNDGEADRCYSKSARLGNVHAKSKLAGGEEAPHS
jgi:TPR repeat protein